MENLGGVKAAVWICQQYFPGIKQQESIDKSVKTLYNVPHKERDLYEKI
jgi:hypothetical protein